MEEKKAEIRRRGKGEDGLSAYYYGFESTGCELVDEILRAVAGAGASAHNTDCWCDESEYAAAPVRSIQTVAQEVADKIKALIG